MNKKEGGAIAAFGSTGLGWLRGDYYLERALFSTLFENGTRQLGAAIAEAKVTLLATHPELVDMVRLYNLLGDPACTLPLPQREIALTALPYLSPDPSPRGEGSGERWERGRGKFALLSTPDNLPPEIQLTITDELYRHERICFNNPHVNRHH